MWTLFRRNARRAKPARRAPSPVRPRLEVLEDRCVPSGAGSLDPTFGNGAGYVTTLVSTSSTASVSSVLIQPDSKILVAGSEYAGTNVAPPEVFAVVRYNTDGSLDTSFGSGGLAIADFPGAYINGWRYSQSYASALYPQAGTVNDGKIVLVGGHETSNNGGIFALARFNTNGTLDSTFGNSGEVTTSFPVPILTQGGAQGVVIQSDGEIVAAGGSTNGFVLARYNTNGSLDTTFGSDGEVVTSLGANSNVSALLLQSDGKLIVAGDTGGDLWEVARYNPDGSLDTSFGNGGIVSGTFGFGAGINGAALYSINSANAGKILIGGSISTGGGIARLNSDGSLDSTFGVGGEVTSLTGSPPHTVAIAADDKIVTTGPDNGSPALERYNPDGSADNTFGVDGVAQGAIGGKALTIESNGDIVVAGSPVGSYGYFAAARFLSQATSTYFTITGPSSVTAGTAGTYTISVFNPDGSPDTGYSGTVHITSSDPKAVLPANLSINGDTATFTATLETAGLQSLTATDTVTSSITGSDASITITPAAASQFILSAPSSVSKGSKFSVTLTVEDAFGNVVTGYVGTVHFSSSDSSATLPKNYTFTASDAGVHTFTNAVIFKTRGKQTLTVTDTQNSALTATDSIQVS